MANTIRASKNTFQGGLVMDLSPDTTPNEVLTSALNATLVTFNGNELQLQNDMGNGRVETARLPEGYIPVGTCEFGDIIYIVSYNPLTNKSQIGCFPSPERNISSEEIGSTGQILKASDFQELDGSGNATGELNASSVKKIIYNNKLNPGDKFIIYDKNNVILNNKSTITDIGNDSHEYGAWPKLLRIHVVAIEDSGKINYLDSTLKWYDVTMSSSKHDYFIQHMGSGIGGKKIDIDQYRNALSSGYSVFQSKISGKLALLIEVEKITGFSCTYSIYGGDISKGSTLTYKDYKVYWNISWETEDPNINPMCIVLTKSKLIGRSPEDSDNNNVGYRTWINEPTDKGDVKLSNYNTAGITLPKAFNTSDYWHAYISPYTASLSTLYGTEYSTFKSTNSFNARLQSALSRILNTNGALSGQALTKLNVYLDDDNIPEPGKYYINASQLDIKTIEDEETHEPSISKIAYTQNSTTGKMDEIFPVYIDDIIVNNYFHHSVYKEFATFTIPIEQTYTKDGKEYSLTPDLSNLIYNYEITPAMSYGLLREYSVEGFIDFGKIGTGAIDLNVYKYFVGENAITLTLGMDAYVEDNKGIDEVCIEFYDNQGLAASYHIGNKDSYSGQFTEVIPLNGVTNTSKLRDTDYTGKSKLHLGVEANEGDENLVKYDDGEIVKTDTYEAGVTYINDCGTLYSNMLYLAKIIIKYCPKDALGELDPTQTGDFKVFWRWMYTIPMFNDYYFQVQDFDNIKMALTLDVVANYTFTNKYYYKVFNYESENNGTLIQDGAELYKYLSAKVQLITNTGNVTKMYDGDSTTPDTPDIPDTPEEPFAATEIKNSETTFEIVCNNTITAIDYDELGLEISTSLGNPQYQPMVRGTDYQVVSGVGSTLFKIEFENVGRTFLIRINISSAAIKHNNEALGEISSEFGYNNGVPVNTV